MVSLRCLGPAEILKKEGIEMSDRARVVKSCDLPVVLAARLFCALNPGKVRILEAKSPMVGTLLATNEEPLALVYPEGWYFAKHCFRNKHLSTSGYYEEVPMIYDRPGVSIEDYEVHEENYCTL